MKNFLKIAFVFLMLSAVSCRKDDDETAPSLSEQQVAIDENQVQNESDDVTAIQDDVMGRDGVSFGRVAAATDTSFSWESCATVTVVPRGNNATGKITVDFGTGCAGPDGRIRKGKLEWTFTSRLREPGAIIVTRFMDYGVKRAQADAFVMVDNASTLTTTNENTQPFNPSSPVLNLRRDISMILRFSDNTTFSRSGTRSVTWDLGAPGNRWDNVYTIRAGSSVSGKDRQGRAYTATVRTDVIRKTACALLGVYKPVSGIVDLVREGKTMTLDYGNGVCDQTVLVTRNGKSVRTRW